MSGKPPTADPSADESLSRSSTASPDATQSGHPEVEPVAAELAGDSASQTGAADTSPQVAPAASPEQPPGGSSPEHHGSSPEHRGAQRSEGPQTPSMVATVPQPPRVGQTTTPPEPTSRHWRKNWLIWLPLTLVAVFVILAGPAMLLMGGFHRMAGVWFIVQAEQRYQADDLEEAERLLDRAAAWLPDDPLVYDHRGQVRLERNDPQGALADFNRVIELNPHYYGGYAGRSAALQRLGRFREAIDDCNRAIKLRPESDPAPWNNRAYARALGNMELDTALSDIEHAIELSGEKDGNEVAAYLDTRGYIRFRLGQHEAALADLNRAVELAQRAYEQLQQADEQTADSANGQKRRTRLAREELAVILHHRGLTHRALGHTAQADEDLQRAKQLGYDPARGVQ